ncbi:MAG TPA: tRNA (adenosine(37)-N6)-threonylcarbamoyltransferase complex ATPase subunit type 1 TsaE [Bacteroidia bacterium]
MITASLKNISELSLAAKTILDFASRKYIFCFYGELGAGKTTLIKEICKQLGVKEEGSSPTFSLINEYRTPYRLIYHFDLYRLKNENEIFDIGYEEYIFSGNYCFIEWPEKIEHLLPADFVKVKIEVKGSERVITVK